MTDNVLRREYGFVYGIQSLDLIKVGSAENIEKRLTVMRLYNPHGCELVFYRRTYAPLIFEKRMHELLADKAVGREWFRASLADVRQAALKARLDSIKAERSLRRKRYSMALTHQRHSPSENTQQDIETIG